MKPMNWPIGNYQETCIRHRIQKIILAISRTTNYVRELDIENVELHYQTMIDADKFLISLGYLEGSPGSKLESMKRNGYEE